MGILDDAHRDGVVVGLASECEAPIARQDIDAMLLNQPDTFNLMVIAFLEIMDVKVPWDIDEGYKVTKDDKFSFYQMAGIHCLPLTPWDNAADKGHIPDPTEEDGDSFGYCLHGTPAFEPWHRPYLVMLEQALYRQIENVAQRFGKSDKVSPEQKEKYLKAAKQFRLPFIDYFRPRGYARMIPGKREFDDPTPIGGMYPRLRGTAQMTWVPYDYSLPQIFTLPKIMVKTLPNNELKAVRNPFFSFDIPEGSISELEWKAANLDMQIPQVRNKTMRYGSNKPKSVALMNDNLNKLQEDQVRMMLTLIEDGAYTKMSAFMSAGADAIPKEFSSDQGIVQSPKGSLEAVHNDFHVYYGGFAGTRMGKKFGLPNEFFGKENTWAGHMTSVPVAAFDPVFWIHHAQIDRLFAIWQTVNPYTWFKDLKAEKDQQLADKSLLPFRQHKQPSGDIFWTPNEVRDWTKFGYTYPDLEGDKSPEAIRKRFYEMYAWSRRLIPGDIVGIHLQCPEEMSPLDVSKAQVFQFDEGSAEEYLFEGLGPKHDPVAYAKRLNIPYQTSRSLDSKYSIEWYIDDVVERMALNVSFTIFYIIDVGNKLGKLGEEQSGANWISLPGFAGLTHIFVATEKACDNCAFQSVKKDVVTSTTPITSLLIDYVETGHLKSMKQKDVADFLVQNLKWRIQTVTGQIINPRQLHDKKSFNLTISSKTSLLPGVPDEPGYPNVEGHKYIINTILGNASKVFTLQETLEKAYEQLNIEDVFMQVA